MSYNNIIGRREQTAATTRSFRSVSTGSTNATAARIGLLLVTVCVVAVLPLDVPDQSSSSSLPRQRRAVLSPDQMKVCDTMCSNGDWCPLWCPEHTLFIRKRADRPFTDEDLSFDDYLFLKLMGRSRK